MKRNIQYFLLTLLSGMILSCDENTATHIPPVEERVSEAISELRSNLVSPANGWKVEYQPTEASGIFFMLLKFNDEGLVSIESDMADNGGEFYDQTISYRIDSRLGLKLVLETYAVFHYMFEQDAATFGAEFEFYYEGAQGDNLLFRSASDASFAPSVIVFEPASPGDENSFSREIAENLNQFSTISPKALQPPIPKQQIILEDEQVSVIWSLDPAKRIMVTLLAGSGTNPEDPAFEPVTLDHASGYKLLDGAMVLLNPLVFTLDDGNSYTISSISFSDFSLTGPAFCTAAGNTGPEYKGQISGIGEVTMISSLYDPGGTDFQPETDFPYSVNIPFLFDELGNSLTDPGNLINRNFPDAVAFLFYYGYVPENDSLPSNSVGFVLTDDQGNSEVFVREFEPTQTVGNKIHIVLNDTYFHTGTPGPDDEANLAEVTDKLFEGGYLYASDFPVEGLTVFNLFNPCNQYEIFLVK